MIDLITVIRDKMLVELKVPGNVQYIRLLSVADGGIYYNMLYQNRNRTNEYGAPIYKVFSDTVFFVPMLNVLHLKIFGEIGKAGVTVEEDDGKWDEMKNAIRV